MGTEFQQKNREMISNANTEISPLENIIIGKRDVGDELQRRNYELMEVCQEKARKLSKVQAFLAYIYNFPNQGPYTSNTVQEQYDQLECPKLISPVL